MNQPLFHEDIAFLSSATPPGVFRSFHGAEYLVIQDSLAKRAISLGGTNDPTYSFRDLDEVPIAYGVWMGPAKVRLTAKLEGLSHFSTLGMLSLCNHTLLLTCVKPDGYLDNVQIAQVEADDEDTTYAGWQLLRVGDGAMLHNQNPEGRLIARRFIPDELRVATQLMDVEMGEEVERSIRAGQSPEEALA